jgi:hypothetical protein
MSNLLVSSKPEELMGDKWITVVNKRSQIRRKEVDIRNKLRIHKDDENMKKILCNNILVSGGCHYGSKCMYAHSISEQNMDPIRKRAYDIIMGNDRGSCKPDKELGRTLLQLTKVCENCIRGKCPGGYNCKYGVFDRKYQVCADDLRYGICYNDSCSNIHLTNRGLIPLNSNSKSELRVIKCTDRSVEASIPSGTLLSDDFFVKLSGNIKSKGKSYPDSDDSESGSTERIREYLEGNSDSDRSCSESIFD